MNQPLPVEGRIKQYMRKIDPGVLGLSQTAKDVKAKRLGLGESNLNYLVNVDGNQFVFRINMDPRSPNKSKTEFDSLKMVEGLGIAPKAFHYEASKECFGETFVILQYVEGETLEGKMIDERTMRELASSVAGLHNTSVGHLKKKLRKSKSSKREMMQRIKQRIEYVNSRRKRYFLTEDWFSVLLAQTLQDFNRKKIGFATNYVLGHGDIAPQNVIIDNGKLKLVDWEDLGLIDAGVEIATIFDSFDFSETQKEKFLKEYTKLRKDQTIKRRIRAYWPIQLFGVFCWAVMHVFEIGEGEMHESFIHGQGLQRHVDYARKMFEKCRNEGIFCKKTRWKSSDVFPSKYLTQS